MHILVHCTRVVQHLHLLITYRYRRSTCESAGTCDDRDRAVCIFS
jgi:hypothetical protein